MVRRITALALTVLLALSLCGCDREIPPRNDSAPGRMVRRIDVAIHPADPDYDRTYETQENMNALLGLLRDLETAEYPETEPDIHDGESYYTATVTFANGKQSVYCLLGHTYLRLGEKPWCIVTSDQAMTFVDFLRTHPSDNTPDPTAPTE